MRCSFFVLSVLALNLLIGCGPSGPPMVMVSGSVTFEGQPIPEGTISFFAEDDKAISPDGGVIKDGRFSFKVKLGKKRVEISASRPVKDMKPGEGMGGVPPQEEYLPERYNTKSELKAEISAANRELVFDLKK